MPRFAQTYHLVAQSLITGSPAIGQPALGQVHNLDADGLTALALPPFGRTPEEIGFIKLLIENISASPNRRTKSKRELVERGMTMFGLSKRRAIALRERVIDWLDARAWSRAGARRRNRS
jgi:hypothetical protein